ALYAGNKYVTDTSPWHMASDDPRRLVVVRTLLEILYIASLLLQPVLTHATSKVFLKLATPPLPICKASHDMDNVKPGTEVTVGEVLFAKPIENVSPAWVQIAQPFFPRSALCCFYPSPSHHPLPPPPLRSCSPAKVETAEALEKAAAEAAAKKKAMEASAKKQAAKAKAEAASGPQSDLSKCKMVVGKIVQVKLHPEAEALYVEQIDLGEGAARQVVSGLVKHIPIDQMQGRAVVVLANLKPNKLRGVESQAAMVLCGTSPDGNTVELVEPPAGAAVGERVSFEGHEGEPDDVLNPKKKIWEKEVQPKLNTSDAGVARFEGLPFMTSAGPCTVKTAFGGTIK
ncbi:MAG: hypothetical protein SGPRY_007956, partial [Prymnesium sp.]